MIQAIFGFSSTSLFICCKSMRDGCCIVITCRLVGRLTLERTSIIMFTFLALNLIVKLYGSSLVNHC